MQLNDYLGKVSNQINARIVGNQKIKDKFCKHIEKIIRKAEEYGQYLRAEWQKAKRAGLTQYDKNKDEENEDNENKGKEKKWFWWMALSDDWEYSKGVYFTTNELLDVRFYTKEKLKPDPLWYLKSMIWGSVGKDYEGLECLDYQFVLLAIIHDAQNWQAGRERIYFNPLGKKILSDRLCQVVWDHLSKRIWQVTDVQQTIETALLAVKAELVKAKSLPHNTASDEKADDNNDFLLNTAAGVERLILDGAIKHFKEQVKTFYDSLTEYFSDQRKAENPLDRLWLPYPTNADAHIGLVMDDDYFKRKKMPYDKKKSLQADYVLLTIIHDKRLGNPRTPCISDGIWSKDEEWVNSIWEKLQKGNQSGNENIQVYISESLDRVKADIGSLFVETQPASYDEARKKLHAEFAPKIIAGSREVWRLLQENENRLAAVSERVQSIGRDNSGKAGKTKTVAKKLKKPISDKAAAVYELLKTMPEHRGLTGRKIIEELSKKNIFIDQSTLTKNIIPILKTDYYVKNEPRIGYYIAK